MLRPIKTFYVDYGVPTYEDWCEAVKIAKEEQCVVEIRWLPSRWAGWYHEYVFMDSDPEKLDQKTPINYGV
jgi:hypothetical protein